MLNKTAIVIGSLLIVSSAVAQSTWTVDALNGPGTDYLDLPAAVAASSAGDTILVRYADPVFHAYTAPTITHGLTVVGVEGGAPGISGELRVESLPATEHVVIRNLRLGPFPGAHGPTGHCRTVLTGNAGSVHMQNVYRWTASALFGSANEWLVEDCGVVTFSHCTFRVVDLFGAHRISNTELVTFEFVGIHTIASSAPALELINSRLVMTDSSVDGYAPIFGVGGPGIEMCNSQLELVDGEVTGGTSSYAVRKQSGCVGNDAIALHAGATIDSALGITPTQSTVHALTGLLYDNDQIVLRIGGPANGIAVLAFGEPAAVPVPALNGTLYLDPLATGVFDVVALDADGFSFWDAYLLPGVPTGASVWLQGLTFDPNGPPTLTTPAVLTMP